MSYEGYIEDIFGIFLGCIPDISVHLAAQPLEAVFQVWLWSEKTSKCSIVAEEESLKAKASKGDSGIVSGGDPAWYQCSGSFNCEKDSTSHTHKHSLEVPEGEKPKIVYYLVNQ